MKPRRDSSKMNFSNAAATTTGCLDQQCQHRTIIRPKRRMASLIQMTALLILATAVAVAAESNSNSTSSPSGWEIASIPTSNHHSQHTNPHPLSTIPQSGPIDDATCNVEQLEEANDSQLFTILEDLKETTFFRNFAVDLDAKCPLAEWVKSKSKGKENKKKVPVEADEQLLEGVKNNDSDEDDDDEDGKCTSELPDADPTGPAACSLASSGNEMSWLSSGSKPGSGFGSSGSTSSSSSSNMESNESVSSETRTAAAASASAATTSASTELPQSSANTHTNKKEETDQEEEEDYECDGGDVADEMEDDAPPLCQLTESEMTNLDLFEQSTTPIQDLVSSAFQAMNEKLGWDSESQKDTFMWSKKTNPVVLSSDKGENCDDELVDGALPDTFWLDLCSNIKEGDGMKVVDLMLNPERNTGYNGTHIWRAIYEENCIDMDGITDQPMCYEERVLYRLLSGLHASTTLSIAKNYYPPNKRKGRENWEANPKYFYEQFHDHPEYIRNLHFSYVVLLRALKKASPVLYKYEIKTGNIVDDETATILLRRLLDSSILTSCNDVFHAFDESLMFHPDGIASANGKDFDDPFTNSDEIVALQQNFKGVFHNVSSILDCVQCQQCKLHGKMAMLGYGTALKILFTSREELIAGSLNRNEVIALINTVAKMSEALIDVRELTHLYWTTEIETTTAPDLPEPVDAAIGLASALANAGLISAERELELVNAAMAMNKEYLDLANQFALDLEKFATLSDSVGNAHMEPDAIVIGTGLAGLAAALNILDRGGRVTLIEKEHRLGGNSNKASSGINACCPNNGTTPDDLMVFQADTTKSAGSGAQPELIQTLVENSGSAVFWLRERVGVDLSLIAQLGGHKHKRTHRPKNGMVGAEVIYGMQKAVKQYEKSGMVTILTDTKVIELVRSENRVVGVELKYLNGNPDDIPTQLNATSVILATGGFAADRRDQSYLASYRPELLNMPATAGAFSTGDGITLAKALGAGLVDMDKVQIHPTGWVDPSDPHNQNKILAAELMRGVGGMLINDDGKRFSNELGTRAYVTDMMLGHDEDYARSRKWNITREIPTFALVLSSAAAEDGKKHVDHYVHKELVTKLEGIHELAKWMGQDVEQLRDTLLQYRMDAEEGVDQWGKKSFQGLPSSDLDGEVFYAGRVTPVLHYCMGGITIDSEGNVLDEDRNIIQGLYAAGEVTGGVHGNNRLGGNSLLECTVFGTIVGKRVPIEERKRVTLTDAKPKMTRELRDITMSELANHDTEDDCWVDIFGKIYDLTSFAEEHPAGAQSIYDLCGKDGTEAFETVHNQGMMEDFEEVLLGKLIVQS